MSALRPLFSFSNRRRVDVPETSRTQGILAAVAYLSKQKRERSYKDTTIAIAVILFLAASYIIMRTY